MPAFFAALSGDTVACALFCTTIRAPDSRSPYPVTMQVLAVDPRGRDGDRLGKASIGRWNAHEADVRAKVIATVPAQNTHAVTSV